MLLTHISGTHFRSRGEKLYGFIDISAVGADVVPQLNALHERPDAVVTSGDIVSCGRLEEYQVARQILSDLNYPLYLIPGSHDNEAHFLEHLHPLCPQLGDDPQNMCCAADNFATHLLFIDSSRADTSRNWLTDKTIGRLEAQLLKGGDKPTAVFIHHLPLPLGNVQTDPIACESGHRLLVLMERFPSLTCIFCGHNRSLTMTQYHQALTFIIPDAVHQVPYCHRDTRSYYDLSPVSCLMHRQVDGQWASYQHSLVHYAGPWPCDEDISCPTEKR